MRRLIVLVVVLFPALSMAQHSRFELTPTVGYRWGGGIDVYERALEFDNYDAVSYTHLRAHET